MFTHFIDVYVWQAQIEQLSSNDRVDDSFTFKNKYSLTKFWRCFLASLVNICFHKKNRRYSKTCQCEFKSKKKKSENNIFVLF